MPIRFRCPQCARLLGIARRKAGTRINCPQCAAAVTVPVPAEGGDGEPDFQDLDNLLNLAAPSNGVSHHLPDPEPAQPAVATEPPPAAPPRAKPKREPGKETPLFEKDDFDALLGMTKPAAALEFSDKTSPKARPVSGMDAGALNLDDVPGKIVLSPQRAVLLVIAVVVLLVLAFVAGFLIASKT
jgi:hypothetical protein